MNLTSLANVKSWVGSQSTQDDILLARLLGDASRTILNYLQRADIGMTTFTETISGKNTRKIGLRNWPVLAVNSLSINGVVIPASTGPTVYGYALEQVYGSTAGRPQMLGIVGSVPASGGGYYGQSPPTVDGSLERPFSGGVNNILVNYSYGYTVQNEAQTIPASVYRLTPLAINGGWIGDVGVTYAAGGALVAIASGTPATGHYVPPNLNGDSPTPYYQFAAGDANTAVLLNYNFVPYDLEQACIEVVGERYRYRARIGQASQSLGGQETASYLVKDMLTAAIKGRLDPYRLVWGG